MQTSHAGERFELAKGKTHYGITGQGPVDHGEGSIFGKGRHRAEQKRKDAQKSARPNLSGNHDGHDSAKTIPGGWAVWKSGHPFEGAGCPGLDFEAWEVSAAAKRRDQEV